MNPTVRGWLEVLAIVVLLPVGTTAGALTGITIMGSLLGVGLPLVAATLFLRREGTGWSSLYAGSPLSMVRVFQWTLLTIISVWLVVQLASLVLVKMGVPPANYDIFVFLIEDNLLNYLLFLGPVAWGSAAVGEELLARGFLLHRIEGLSNTAIAVILQAILFAAAHAYQGWMGVVSIFLLAIIFGIVYIRCGRHLLPLILAHGIIDSISLTLVYLGHADWLTGAG
ncbi:MAG: type II CAAX endopeptidase family protein [Proteobacteria bacterium]|nr:type II CAAX endopeptidase family protein [Pseudomonadota bacterium]